MTEKRLIQNAMKTPDGTILYSRHRHDYVTYTDKNGKKYMLDGGLDYIRSSAHGDEVYLSLFDDEPHEVQRNVIVWGTYGKEGNEPLRYVTVSEMDTDHIEAVLEECRPATHIKNCLEKELEYRRNTK